MDNSDASRSLPGRPHYLYVLSNSSMPGLIKVGHTSRDPALRARELSSTGLPTPFEIQLVIRVNSGPEAETNAHRLLRQYRVQRNREFFRISKEDAITIILRNIKYATVDWQHTPRNSDVGELVIHDLTAQLESIRSARSEIAKELKRQGGASRILAISDEIRSLEAGRDALGERPVLKEPSTLGYLLQQVYSPVPIGWLFWILGWYLYKNDLHIALAVLLSSFLLGGLSSLLTDRREKRFNYEVRPWMEIDQRIAAANSLRSRLQGLRHSDAEFAQNEVRLAAIISSNPLTSASDSGAVTATNSAVYQSTLFEDSAPATQIMGKPLPARKLEKLPTYYYADKVYVIHWDSIDYIYVSEAHALNAIEKFRCYGPPWSPFGLHKVRRSESADGSSRPIY